MSCQLRLNQKGGLYDNGRKLPLIYRERILDLHHSGISQRAISRELKVSLGYVQNVVHDYDVTNSAIPPLRKVRPKTKLHPGVIGVIENEKLCKPTMHLSEVRNRLVLDGVVHPVHLPSTAAISKCIRKDMMMTRKKISVVPIESKTPEIENYTNYFLDQISSIDSGAIHFFDESGVVKTCGNRRYGHSYKGEVAFEIQKYAANCNYTLNLLHSIHGVDYKNILEGPSNGNELLLFFEEAVNLSYPNGVAVLERGDVVVMDNCGFHHGHFVEPMLRNLLGQYGVELLFQAPYSPHLNTCELCFSQIKLFMKRNQQLTEHETEYAIHEACRRISAELSISYFRHFGYHIP